MVCVCDCVVVCILATEYHLGLLKAKLAKYRAQLIEGPKTSGQKVSSIFCCMPRFSLQGAWKSFDIFQTFLFEIRFDTLLIHV